MPARIVKEELLNEYRLDRPRCKKKLMVQFALPYCGVLSRHVLCGTATTGKMVSEATDLKSSAS